MALLLMRPNVFVVRRAATVVNCGAVLPARPHQLKLAAYQSASAQSR